MRIKGFSQTCHGKGYRRAERPRGTVREGKEHSLEGERGGALRMGLVINPVAGMGGRVGLKGTDGIDMLAEAIRRGAEPVTPGCAARFLARLGEVAMRVRWVTCGGEMGAAALEAAGLRSGEHFEVAYKIPEGTATSPEDTQRGIMGILDRGVSALVFCGGDGTARDVMAAVGDRCPVLGVPAGVKMFSGVFALSPEAAGDVLAAFARGGAEEGDGEVVDVDEEAYRRGDLAVRLHGVMRIMRVPTLIQSMKGVTSVPNEGAMQEAIARYVLELLEEEGDPLTLLGAGSTVGAVARAMGVPKTGLGVDVVRAGEVLVSDGSEADLLAVLEDVPRARIVISPIGAQGFLLGRGNQQISAEVLEAAGGPASLMIVATPHKIRGIPALQVDTGNAAMDARLAGMHRVVVGYHDVAMAMVVAASAPPD
jgi:predicted polyphosphate/ATP-dependent NAD kinase